MTTSCLIRCPGLPQQELTQSMHWRHIRLDYHEVMDSPALGHDEFTTKISDYFIIQAILDLHGDAVQLVFKESSALLPVFPFKERLKRRVDEVRELGAIFKNTGTIDGTYAAHDEIFQQKLGLDPSPDSSDFSSRLRLVWGDQKTCQHIRSVKDESSSAELPYDRRDWMLAPPALFHVQMQLLNMIVRTHFSTGEGSQQFSSATLLHDITTLQRKGISRDSAKYHLTEPLLVVAFNARVLALFYEQISQFGALQGTKANQAGTRESMDEAIKKLTAEQILEAARWIQENVFSPFAWEGVVSTGSEETEQKDQHFTSMCRYLQEIEVFLTLRHAIRHGDIGIIQHILPLLSVMFYGNKQYNYGFEMLFLHWLLKEEVSSPELRRAILASALINLSNKSDCWLPIDLIMELANGRYHIDMKNRHNSTHDINTTFGRVALTSLYANRLRKTFETTFSRPQNNKHSRKKLEVDTFLLAHSLWRDGETEARPNRPDLRQWLSRDIIGIGLEDLEEKVAFFNQSVPVDDESLHAPIDGEAIENENEDRLASTEADNAEIREFALEADDGLFTNTAAIMYPSKRSYNQAGGASE